MKLELTESDFKAALSETILAQLGTEGQKAIISEAIQELVLPRKDTYNSYRPSVIQAAFSKAAADLAYEMVVDMVRNDPKTKSQVEDLVKGAVEEILTNETVCVRISSALRDGIEKAWSGRDY